MDIKQEQEVLIKIAEHTEQIKVANHRISDLEATTKRIEKLTMSVEKLAMSCEAMTREQSDYRAKQNELAKRLLEVEQLPTRKKAGKWDKYMGQIATIIIGALISFLLFSLLGLST